MLFSTHHRNYLDLGAKFVNYVVNITVTGTVGLVLFTHSSPSGTYFVPTIFCTYYISASATAPSTNRNLSFGTVGATYVDYVANYSTGFASIGTFVYPALATETANRVGIAPGASMYIRSSNIEAGRSGTFRVFVRGFLVE